MTKSLPELLAQREALDAEIANIQRAEKSKILVQVRELVAAHGLTSQEVFGGSKSVKTGSVAVKYRHPTTGQTWTGRGKQPKWIAGQDKAQFAV